MAEESNLAPPVLDIVDLGVALPSGADRPFAVRNISFSVNAG